MVTVVTAVLLLGAQAEPATAARKPGVLSQESQSELFGKDRPKLRGSLLPTSVPLPKPRPADAPASNQTPAASDKPAAEAAPAPPSACRLALSEEIAIAPSIPDIHGPGDCGGEDLVRLEAVVLPDKHRVAVKPAAILRCAMATAIADWIRTDVAPLGASLGSVISDLDNFDSFECRGRNRVVRSQTVRTRPRQRARRSRIQARQRPIDFTDRPHGVARTSRERAAFGVRAVFDRAGTGLGLVP